MAEKEERILIARSTDYTITDTDKGKLFEGKIKPHCAIVMTRAEAIERMANHLRASTLLMDSDPEVYAEAALNALLGVEK
jgi:hypothetical protein